MVNGLQQITVHVEVQCCSGQLFDGLSFLLEDRGSLVRGLPVSTCIVLFP